MSQRVEVGRMSPELWEKARSLDQEGIPRAEIARRLKAEDGVEISRSGLSKKLGRKEQRPSEGSKPLAVQLTPEEIQKLRDLAQGEGYRILNGVNAGQGSISGLLRAVANGERLVIRGTRGLAR
jgi:hypothetical protein